jgi:hypothetical protein
MRGLSQVRGLPPADRPGQCSTDIIPARPVVSDSSDWVADEVERPVGHEGVENNAERPRFTRNRRTDGGLRREPLALLDVPAEPVENLVGEGGVVPAPSVPFVGDGRDSSAGGIIPPLDQAERIGSSQTPSALDAYPLGWREAGTNPISILERELALLVECVLGALQTYRTQAADTTGHPKRLG